MFIFNSKMKQRMKVHQSHDRKCPVWLEYFAFFIHVILLQQEDHILHIFILKGCWSAAQEKPGKTFIKQTVKDT